MEKRTFSITAAKQAIKLDAKRTGDASFTLTNTSDKAIRCQLKVRPIEAAGITAAKSAWLVIVGDTERNFGPQATIQVTVNAKVPGTEPAGKYGFRFDAVSALNPDDDLTEGPPVIVEVPAAEPVAKKNFPWWIPVAAVVLLAIIGGATWLMLPQTVVVPNVVKEAVPLDKAIERIKAANLEAEAHEDKVVGLPANKERIVVRTDPEAGSKVAKGSKVGLYFQVASAAQSPPIPTAPPTPTVKPTVQEVPKDTTSPGGFPPPGPGVKPVFIYRVNADGRLLWARHDGAERGDALQTPGAWVGPRPVGEGWNDMKAVFGGGGNSLYGIDRGGLLKWYQHNGFNTGAGLEASSSWEGPKDVGRG